MTDHGSFEPEEHEIALCAYYRWRAHGCPEGTKTDDWFAAKEFLRRQSAEYHRLSLQAILVSELAGRSVLSR